MTHNIETAAVPHLDRLPPEGERLIHEKSLEILEEFGIRFDHSEAKSILTEAGCTVDEESGIVKIPADLAEQSMQDAPRTVTIGGRGSQADHTLGEGEPIISTAAGPPNVLTYEEGRRPSTMEDFERFQKLVQMEEVIDTVGIDIVVPNDYDESIAFLETQLRALKLTDKIPGGNCYGADRARMAAEMVGIVHDDPDLSENYLIGNANSVSPRLWDTKMAGGVIQHARMGQPVIIAPAVMAGASGPATIAGTMALANAEILAGVTLAQSINPGTPIVYGLPTSNTDLRYGSFAIGSPEGGLFIAMAGQMARFYEVPSRAGGGLTDAKTVDDQAGSESMFQLMTSVTSGIDFISHGAGIMDSYSTTSPEKFVLDAERLRYIQRFADGFELSEETLALDVIGETEPADHFLNERHTLEHGQEEFFIPELAERTSYDDWQSHGGQDSFERARDRVDTLLDEYERPSLDRDIRRDLERYVEEKRADILGT